MKQEPRLNRSDFSVDTRATIGYDRPMGTKKTATRTNRVKKVSLLSTANCARSSTRLERVALTVALFSSRTFSCKGFSPTKYSEPVPQLAASSTRHNRVAFLSSGLSEIIPLGKYGLAKDFRSSLFFHSHPSDQIGEDSGGLLKSSFHKSGKERKCCSSSRTNPKTTLYFFWRNRDDDDKLSGGKSNNGSSSGEYPDESDSNHSKFIVNYLRPTASFLKVAFPSFLAGAIVTLSVLFVPLLVDYYDAYSGNTNNFYGGSESSNNGGKRNSGGNNLNQPVILFETILSDLDAAYVDDVDIQKLFETGVKAMTSSLDPYTEFESRQEAQDLEESVSGRYGGVGLVIRGSVNTASTPEGLDSSVMEKGSSSPKMKKGDQKAADPDSPQSPVATNDATQSPNDDNRKSNKRNDSKIKIGNADTDDDEEIERNRLRLKSMQEGIRVVSAFEGYAFDAGLRVGDKLLAVDDFIITPGTSVEDVRNHLRGEPGTDVSITFLREGVGSAGTFPGTSKTSVSTIDEPQTVTMKRSVVRIPDVKYFGFIGDPQDGIGYIDLSGFANDAGREVRYAIRVLQHGAEMAARASKGAADLGPDGSTAFVDRKRTTTSIDPTQLKGLVIDLRSNPGGLLTSAVDVAALLVPNGSDIVSAKGRGFPEMLYRSKTEPVLDSNTRLAVLVNEQTASAAEIVTGAVQDLDVGVVVGKGRTFGKGLVQNVQDLPYQTALKYTVAKYYTPSGRCIQSTVYREGGRGDDILASSSVGGKAAGNFKATKVANEDRKVYYTAHGREVKDGGGIEVDFKVEPQKASPLEIILLNSGAYADFAAEWSRNHKLTDNFKVDDATYRDFQKFITNRQKEGDIKLEVLYETQLRELQNKLKASGFDSSSRELDKLRSDIVKEVKKDFTTYKEEIIEDIEQNILARYLPESLLIERGLKSDIQVAETVKMLKDPKKFDKILARDDVSKEKDAINDNKGGYETASISKSAPRLQTKW